MALHTVLIAVTVDDKYSTYAVASEINYFLPYITSECLDTVSAVIPARHNTRLLESLYELAFGDGAIDKGYSHAEVLAKLREFSDAALKQVKTFTVWTSAKAEGCDTYAELLAYEKLTGFGYSSQVTTDNIEGIVEAVLNELDSDLLYHLEDAS